MKHTDLLIEGMSCEGCVASVQKALGQVPGVREVRVDLALGGATVVHEDHASPASLVEAVTDAGYDAKAVAS